MKNRIVVTAAAITLAFALLCSCTGPENQVHPTDAPATEPSSQAEVSSTEPPVEDIISEIGDPEEFLTKAYTRTIRLPALKAKQISKITVSSGYEESTSITQNVLSFDQSENGEFTANFSQVQVTGGITVENAEYFYKDGYIYEPDMTKTRMTKSEFLNFAWTPFYCPEDYLLRDISVIPYPDCISIKAHLTPEARQQLLEYYRDFVPGASGISATIEAKADIEGYLSQMHISYLLWGKNTDVSISLSTEFSAPGSNVTVREPMVHLYEPSQKEQLVNGAVSQYISALKKTSEANFLEVLGNVLWDDILITGEAVTGKEVFLMKMDRAGRQFIMEEEYGAVLYISGGTAYIKEGNNWNTETIDWDNAVISLISTVKSPRSMGVDEVTEETDTNGNKLFRITLNDLYVNYETNIVETLFNLEYYNSYWASDIVFSFSIDGQGRFERQSLKLNARLFNDTGEFFSITERSVEYTYPDSTEIVPPDIGTAA